MTAKQKQLKKTFQSYWDIVASIAISFHLTTGEDVDDLLQECYIAFHKGLQKQERHDPGKSQFSTYLWKIMTNHLSVYTVKKAQVDNVKQEYDDLIIENDPFYENLTDNARTIVESLTDFAAELDLICKKDSKETGEAFLISKMLMKGWDINKAQQAVHELQAAL